jgi:tetratricopeptide (TPR) repeat protein
LFSDLPIPRKNSSLRPPAPDTESPRAETPRAEPAAFEEASDEEPMVDEPVVEQEPERDLDSMPPSRPAFGRTGAERAAIAAGALIIFLAIAFVAKRAMSPRASMAPPSAASEEPRAASAPPVDTLQPAEEGDFPTSPADPAKARDLRREARQLLEKGSAEEGTRVARLAIQADPNDAEGYILLAAGLQDLGRWQESRDVFAKCVQESNRKVNAECVYFATRSK